MKKLLITIVVILASTIFQNTIAQDYYWSANKKHYLYNVQNKYVVKIKSGEFKNFTKLRELVYLIQNEDKKSLTSKYQFEQIIPTKMLIDSTENNFHGRNSVKT